MAKGLGMAIGTGVDRLARGLALGQNLRAAEEQRGLAMEDQAFARKQRAREESNWQREDADRKTQQELRQLQATRRLALAGAYDLNSPRGQVTLNYVRNMSRAFDNIGGQQDPQVLEAARKSFNEHHAEDINKGAGTPLDKDVSIGEGQTLPKGSVINRKEITRVFPRQDGAVRFAVKSYATTPDGKTAEWENFVTQNRSTDDDDPVLDLKVDDLYKNVGDTMTLLDLIQTHGKEKALAMLDAEIIARGGEPDTDSTNAIKEFQFAQKNGFKGTFEDWVAKGGSSGLTAMQREAMSYANDQAFRAYADRPQRMPAYLNIGSGYVDPAGTRAPIDKELPPEKTPEALAAAERAKAEGKAQGEATAELPGSLQKAQDAIHVIDLLINHPGRSMITGKSGALGLVARAPGTSAADANAILKQLQGQAFLEAFESLKGGGHITEVEGQKATEAMARLDTSQSDDAFLQSLQELRGIIERGAERARQRAGRSSADGPTQPRPTQRVSEGATATNPQTGERMVYRGGRWVRL